MLLILTVHIIKEVAMEPPMDLLIPKLIPLHCLT